MTSDIKRYPLDLTAEAKGNWIENESHDIKDINDTVFTLNHGIFYRNRLVIKDINTDEVLIYGTDYILNYLHKEVTKRSGFGAYALVLLKDTAFTGKLSVSYQVVGGQFSRLDDALIQAIDDINATETTIHWENILNKPLTYPPSPHIHDAEDIIGMDDVVDAIDGVADSIQGQNPSEIERLEKEIANRVSNLNYVRCNQVNVKWDLTKDTPLRISLTPFPSAIAVEIDIWQSGRGYSELTVTGELNEEGNWFNRSYMISKGIVPDILVQLFNIDGTSAEVLIITESSSDFSVSPNVVKYLKHRPKVTTASCLDLDTITVPIPDEYEAPIPIWVV